MKKPLKVAAWSGLIVLGASLVFIFLAYVFRGSDIGSVLASASNFIIGIFGILFFYGFLSLGKKSSVSLLKIMSWIGVIFGFILLFAGVVGYVFGGLGSQPTGGTQMVTWILFSFIFGVFSILFGIGVKKLGPGVEYSKASGVLNIVAGITYVVIIGYFVKIVAFVFEIALLFKSSGKIEGMGKPLAANITKPVDKVGRMVKKGVRPIARSVRGKI